MSWRRRPQKSGCVRHPQQRLHQPWQMTATTQGCRRCTAPRCLARSSSIHSWTWGQAGRLATLLAGSTSLAACSTHPTAHHSHLPSPPIATPPAPDRMPLPLLPLPTHHTCQHKDQTARHTHQRTDRTAHCLTLPALRHMPASCTRRHRHEQVKARTTSRQPGSPMGAPPLTIRLARLGATPVGTRNSAPPAATPARSKNQ